MPEILTTEITATRFFNGVHYASCFMIDDPVRLVRVPENDKDPNAIRVELDTGEQLGYIERKLASQIAPDLDKRGGQLTAWVSGLEGGKFSTEPRIHISFNLEQAEAAQPQKKLEYLADCSGYHSYILVNADEALLKEIIEKLPAAGFVCKKSGISHKPSADGRQYQWYIQIKKPEIGTEGKPLNATENEIDTFFKSQYNICSQAGRLRELQKDLETARSQLIDVQQEIDETEAGLSKAKAALEAKEAEAATAIDMAMDYEKEKDALKNERDTLAQTAERLREQGDALRQNVISMERQEQRFKNLQSGKIPSTDSSLEKAIAALCPNISFLRDSLDELSYMPDPSAVLKLIGTLACNPESLKGERFEGTDFKELRFSTGQSNIGRMYYKREKGRVDVLVSNKKEQGKVDKEYLGKRQMMKKKGAT